jgi:hypothetical protein
MQEFCGTIKPSLLGRGQAEDLLKALYNNIHIFVVIWILLLAVSERMYENNEDTRNLFSS